MSLTTLQQHWESILTFLCTKVEKNLEKWAVKAMNLVAIQTLVSLQVPKIP